MERALFGDLIVSGGASAARGPGLAVPLSAGLHAALVAAAALAPGLTPAVLPPAFGPPPPLPPYVAALAPPVGQPGRPARPPGGVRKPGPTATQAQVAAPPAAMQARTTFDDEGAVAAADLLDEAIGSGGNGCVGCVPGGMPDGDPDAGFGGPAAEPAPVRVGGRIDPPRKLRHVPPVYPELAKRAGVEGVVILECTVGVQGRVESLRVLRGHPLLDAAAVEAVTQWLYLPTRLNGTPTAVIMSVTVQFRLGR